MSDIIDEIESDINDFEVTIDTDELRLIVDKGGGLYTYSFTIDGDELVLTSMTENAAAVDPQLDDEILELFEQHPVITPENISEE